VLTAVENVGAGFVTDPTIKSARNPGTIYFK